MLGLVLRLLRKVSGSGVISGGVIRVWLVCWRRVWRVSMRV